MGCGWRAPSLQWTHYEIVHGICYMRPLGGTAGCARPVGYRALPQADELEALASQRAAQQQAVLAQAQAWARTEASQWRSSDWADLASHALRVNLPLKVAEVAGWLAQGPGRAGHGAGAALGVAEPTQTRRDVDDALSSGSNAGVVRSLSAAELAWDVAGAGGVVAGQGRRAAVRAEPAQCRRRCSR